jgi:signal transduction histidine kinase
MGRKILVAEDSPTQAERLRILLKEAGYEVEVANDGDDALMRARQLPPDLVISDVVMPNMDGYTLCRLLRSTERTRRIPIVLLTSQSGPADIIRGLEHGADNFIVKPFEDDDLLKRVARIFEHLDLREQETLVVEITLALGTGQRLTITADKQQIMELLFATAERLGRVNTELERSQKALKEHVEELETKVQERTAELNQSLASLQDSDAQRRKLLSHLLNAQEEERRRIAGELHDDSIQVMAAAGMELGTLRTEVGSELEPRIEALEGVVREAISRLRQMMFELSPPVLAREGLSAALRQHLEHLQQKEGVEVHLEDRLSEQPALETRTILYRIAREALTNVRKHAHAHAVHVRLQPSDSGVLVQVRDDGTGFPYKETMEFTNGHMGLTSMRERAEMAGGWWRVDSAKGQGTAIEFWIPEEAAQ